jgi:bifunctional oligoribonuclease and PAP phosphatase NrnA
MQQNTQSEIAEIFKKYKHFIISSHIHLDGDALGSELALYFMLTQLEKDVLIINQDKTPDIYQFLPGTKKIICMEELSNHYSYHIKPATLLVVLDASNLERIGDIGIDMNQIEFIVNIDHHPSNTLFGKYNYIDSDASSVGEILFQLGKKIGCNITYQMAIPLYTAIVTDTGSFRYANTKARTFQIALHLVKLGVNPNNITNYIYNNNELSNLKLLGEALSNLKLDSSLQISWTIVTRNMLSKTQSKDEETEGIVDKILSIKTVQVSVLFRETKNGNIKVSFRSKGKFNVDQFASNFGGGGHPNAAGCQLRGTIDKITNIVISKLQKELNLLE